MIAHCEENLFRSNSSQRVVNGSSVFEGLTVRPDHELHVFGFDVLNIPKQTGFLSKALWESKTVWTRYL